MTRTIPAGSMILTPEDARILYQVARIADLRQRHRIGDTRTYQLLADISVAAFHQPADIGILGRQEPAFDESRPWTVHRVAIAAGLSDRKVRLDCQQGGLPARKEGTTWLIEHAEAETYIARGRRI
jgi:hypothetical protein